MARGDKSKYTKRQRRKADHIEEGYEKRGVSKKEAERRAWATVNKQEGGAKKKGGSGRKKSSSRKSSSSKKKSSSRKKSSGRKKSSKKS